VSIKQRLAQLELIPRKRRGQNFLIDAHTAEQIISFAQISAGDAVLEIGPGLGALTRLILQVTPRLAVVEIEKKLCDHLRHELFSKAPQNVSCADIRQVDADSIAEQLNAQQLVVVSNVPYSISSEVILWVLKNRRRIKTASLLLQNEFAKRIAADPGEKGCGSLSVLRALYALAELGPQVAGNSFYPAPEVDSALLRLTLREMPLDYPVDEALLSGVVRASFAHRRKTLLNNLCAAGFFQTKDQAERKLEKLAIDPRRRAETLTLAEFVRLSHQLRN
jgi:16S rRNA (adenine1518-N6/adenine1519-N6)-dimethyltransferase